MVRTKSKALADRMWTGWKVPPFPPSLSCFLTAGFFMSPFTLLLATPKSVWETHVIYPRRPTEAQKAWVVWLPNPSSVQISNSLSVM